MIPDRDTALDELAVAIAEATVDRWFADLIENAGGHSEDTLTNEHTYKEK